jgi:hypothetical protein
MARMGGMHIVILIIIAVLTAAFLFSTANAFFPDPAYDDYCDYNRAYPYKAPVDECPEFRSEQMDCMQRGGHLEYEYDNDTGCPISATCNMCSVNFNDARSSAQANRFYALAALSIILILVSLYAVKDDTPLLFAITTGIILGSLVSILIMSFVTLDAFSRYARPFIFLLQIILVILVALKKFPNKK